MSTSMNILWLTACFICIYMKITYILICLLQNKLSMVRQAYKWGSYICFKPLWSRHILFVGYFFFFLWFFGGFFFLICLSVWFPKWPAVVVGIPDVSLFGFVPAVHCRNCYKANVIYWHSLYDVSNFAKVILLSARSGNNPEICGDVCVYTVWNLYSAAEELKIETCLSEWNLRISYWR